MTINNLKKMILLSHNLMIKIVFNQRIKIFNINNLINSKIHKISKEKTIKDKTQLTTLNHLIFLLHNNKFQDKTH